VVQVEASAGRVAVVLQERLWQRDWRGLLGISRAALPTPPTCRIGRGSPARLRPSGRLLRSRCSSGRFRRPGRGSCCVSS